MSITGFPDYVRLSQFKGVLIDLDNTLYLHDPCHKAALKAVFEAFKADLSLDTYDAFKTAYQVGRNTTQDRLLPNGSCRSRLLYFHAMLDAMNRSHDIALIQKMDTTYTSAFLSQMTLDHTAKACLETIKELNLKLCIITNLTTQFQIEKLIALGLDNDIDALVTSEEVGVEKPDASLFELGLSKLNLSASDVIMIGDDEDKDIAGAKALGIATAKVTPNE